MACWRMRRALENLRHDGQHLTRIDRLDEVVADVGAEGLAERRVLLALRDHHDREVRRELANFRYVSRPRLPGICSSSSMMSNGRRRSSSMASSALVAVSTSYPFSRRKMRCDSRSSPRRPPRVWISPGEPCRESTSRATSHRCRGPPPPAVILARCRSHHHTPSPRRASASAHSPRSPGDRRSVANVRSRWRRFSRRASSSGRCRRQPLPQTCTHHRANGARAWFAALAVPPSFRQSLARLIDATTSRRP